MLSGQVIARSQVLDDHPCPANHVVGHFPTDLTDNGICRSPVTGKRSPEVNCDG